MPCMCGDICCPSCGPAQGNYRCLICGQWISDDDVHYDEDGNLNPEFKQAMDEAIRRENQELEKQAP